jgi:dihydroflavonol-4-reductase
MAKALITGGTGFVGSHIARALLAAKHEVRILRRASSKMGALQGLAVEESLGDIMEYEALLAAMKGCDWVFHTAAVADYWRTDRVKMYLVNVHGTRLVLQAAKAAGVRRVIFTSSAAAIGLSRSGGPSDETSLFNLNPSQFPYGHSKAVAEEEVHLAVQAGQEVVIVNPSVILGPGDLNEISGSMITEYARGKVPPFYPAGRITLIDVRDVATAHIAAAEKGAPGQRYILGTADASYKSLWEMIAKVTGGTPPVAPFPAVVAPVAGFAVNALRSLGANLPADGNQITLSARDVIFDCRKMYHELYTPKISVPQMIQDTYDWYVANRVLPASPKAVKLL